MPTFIINHQNCNHCPTKTDIHRSGLMCDICQVILCLSDTYNCFKAFYTPDDVGQPPPTYATSPKVFL